MLPQQTKESAAGTVCPFPLANMIKVLSAEDQVIKTDVYRLCTFLIIITPLLKLLLIMEGSNGHFLMTLRFVSNIKNCLHCI